MPAESDSVTPTREQRLDEVIADYLRAADTGYAPIRDELLARRPDLAGGAARLCSPYSCKSRGLPASASG
jgi:hypothetical protein